MNHKEFCRLLKGEGFDIYSGVPCSILKDIITYLTDDPEFTYVPATKEDEALGIAVGTCLGGKKPVVLMQNSGLGNSINALTSLVLLYKFPILLIISWRGYQGKDAPEHLLMGKYMLDLLKTIEVPTLILSKDDLKEQIKESVKIMDETSIPVALILKRSVVE